MPDNDTSFQQEVEMEEVANLPPPDNIDTREYAEGERFDWYNATGEWFKLPWEERRTICWKCFENTGLKVEIIRRANNDTGTYGHTCDTCGYNLEENPRWGKGGPRDLAIHRGERR